MRKQSFDKENIFPGACKLKPRHSLLAKVLYFHAIFIKLLQTRCCVSKIRLSVQFLQLCFWLWGANLCSLGTKAFPQYKQQLLRLKTVTEKPLFPRSLFKTCVSIMWTRLMEALLSAFTSKRTQVERLIQHWCEKCSQPFKTQST